MEDNLFQTIRAAPRRTSSVNIFGQKSVAEKLAPVELEAKA
jgi:hypothetical protein